MLSVLFSKQYQAHVGVPATHITENAQATQERSAIFRFRTADDRNKEKDCFGFGSRQFDEPISFGDRFQQAVLDGLRNQKDIRGIHAPLQASKTLRMTVNDYGGSPREDKLFRNSK